MYSHKLSGYFKAFKPWDHLRNLFYRKHIFSDVNHFQRVSPTTPISLAKNKINAYEKATQVENALSRDVSEREIKKWRNNWKSFINTEISSFKQNSGAISNIVMKLANRTSVSIDYVQIRVLYVEENGKLYKSEYKEVFDVEPSSTLTLPFFDSPKASSLKVYISHIVASAFNFEFSQDCYE